MMELLPCPSPKRLNELRTAYGDAGLARLNELPMSKPEALAPVPNVPAAPAPAPASTSAAASAPPSGDIASVLPAEPPIGNGPSLTLTEEQAQAVAEARTIYEEAGGVLDEKLALPFLMRFLVAHRWSVKKASKMLRATAEWRKTSGANGVRAQLLEGSLKFVDFPFARKHMELLWALPLFSYTAAGDVLTFMQVGVLADRMPRWYAEVTDDDFAWYNLHILELYAVAADTASVRTGRLVQSSVAFDCKGCNIGMLSTRLVGRLKPVLPLPDLYYPELVGPTFALNAPWIVHTLWNMIRVFLSKELQAKVVICSGKDTATTFMSHCRPEDVPTFVTETASSATMPATVAEVLGLAGLSEEELGQLYVNQQTIDPFRVPKYPAAAGRS